MVPLFHLETVRLRVVSCPKYHNMVSGDSQLRINIRNYQTFDNLQKCLTLQPRYINCLLYEEPVCNKTIRFTKNSSISREIEVKYSARQGNLLRKGMVLFVLDNLFRIIVWKSIPKVLSLQRQC